MFCSFAIFLVHSIKSSFMWSWKFINLKNLKSRGELRVDPEWDVQKNTGHTGSAASDQMAEINYFTRKHILSLDCSKF